MKPLSIQLNPDKFDRANNRDSLGALLQEAVGVTHPAIQDEREIRREATWISRWAIRAVCEEIKRRGNISLPLVVRFASAAECEEAPGQSKVIAFPG